MATELNRYLHFDPRYGRMVWSRRFPPYSCALPNGLLAFGGRYDAGVFLEAYRQGIFPWPSGDTEEGLIPWFCPPERFVLEPGQVHLSHSLRRTLRKSPFLVCADRDFEGVIRQCAAMPRAQAGTWITEGMVRTFCELHRMGHAHSVECYRDGALVGGFYGLCLGRVFGGESMFTRASDAPKVAFAVFAGRAHAHGLRLIDCQCPTENLARYGAHGIPRDEYLGILRGSLDDPMPEGFWAGEWAVPGTQARAY